jgi:lipoprotein-releasing system ATP-binding protein
MEAFLTARDIKKEFTMGGRPLTVLSGVSIDVRRGEILAIVGPSGAGKSTLLHILGLIDRHSSGSIALGGQDLNALSERGRAQIRNRRFGFVFQFYHLVAELSALENVMLPRMVGRSTLGWFAERRNARESAEGLLRTVGLGERLRHRPSQLSGGERQRVAIARALVNDPEIVFCDEPTGNLDTATSREIQHLMVEMNRKSGRTFIIVTHDEGVAQRAHRVIKLVDGRVVENSELRALGRG